MKLEPVARSPFKLEFVEVNDDEKIPLSDFMDKFYEGQLLDDPKSRVKGSIIDGVFYGTIETSANGRYYVESTRTYNKALRSQSIIYHEADVLDNFEANIERQRKLRSVADSLKCGYDDAKEWIKKAAQEVPAL
jgi:hypothetical protein